MRPTNHTNLNIQRDFEASLQRSLIRRARRVQRRQKYLVPRDLRFLEIGGIIAGVVFVMLILLLLKVLVG